ncbi:MAG TPA: glycosyltransferase family 2 protein [Candidatus Eisenbacteria bacterium]|nr:glycosyltransferase family 2 protein [Candidatus Eisenbacteria bacterium]
MEPLPVSALVLARDASARLERLLPALAFCRERVVVVDAATRDDSRAVAERAGACVFERAMDGRAGGAPGFGAQRQFALAQCREPWVLWVDTDEALDARAVRALEGAVALGRHAGYRLLRRTWFLGRRIDHCGWSGERVLRLFRRERARFDEAAVHEQVRIDGMVGDLEGTLEHHSYDSWAECRAKLVHYAAAGAAEARRRGRRAGPLDVLVRPPARFARMYVLQAGFLDGAHGVAVCALAAAQVLLKYAELWAEERA